MAATKKIKYEINSPYIIHWRDHLSCYARGWTDKNDMNFEDLECSTVGFFIEETKTSVFLALSKYRESNDYSNVMQILKSCITEQKKLR